MAILGRSFPVKPTIGLANTNSLFKQAATGSSLTADTTAYTLGMQFSLSQSAQLIGIWFYSAPGAAVLPAACAIYQVTGAGTGSQVSGSVNTSPSWSGVAGSGWVKCTYVSGPVLSSGTNYKVVVQYGGGSNWYSTTANYWSSGAGSAGITSGIISAPNNAGGDGGQDTFVTPSAGLTYPSSAFNASNYWIDVEVLPVSSVTISGAVAASSVIAVAGSLVAGPISGAVATSSVIAPAGTVSISIPGASSNNSVTANAGTVVVNIAGGTAASSVVASAGTITETISGVAGTVSDSAIAGTVNISIPGSTPSSNVSASGGSIGITIPGIQGAINVTAVPGTFISVGSNVNITGVVSSISVSAIPGTVLVSVQGKPASMIVSASAGLAGQIKISGNMVVTPWTGNIVNTTSGNLESFGWTGVIVKP